MLNKKGEETVITVGNMEQLQLFDTSYEMVELIGTAS